MNQNETVPSNVETRPGMAEVPGVARVHDIPSGSVPQSGGMIRSTLMGDFVGGLLQTVTRILSPGLLEQSLSVATKIGHYAVLGGGALTIVYAIFGATKHNSFAIFVIGLGFVAALAV